MVTLFATFLYFVYAVVIHDRSQFVVHAPGGRQPTWKYFKSSLDVHPLRIKWREVANTVHYCEDALLARVPILYFEVEPVVVTFCVCVYFQQHAVAV